jgi:D-lactate dehydrogenase (cytochrome)
VTEITLKLTVIPQETSVAVVTFPTIRDAAAASSKIMRAGVPVAAMEIMDEVQMKVINQTGVTKKKWKEVPTMFFKQVAVGPFYIPPSLIQLAGFPALVLA